MPPLVILYQRSDVAWNQLTEETYLDQQRDNPAVVTIGRRRKEQLLERIRWWNRCFSLSYFDYRQALKDIANSAHSRITNVDLVIRNRHHVNLLETINDAIIIPVDDDDWFAPHVADVLRASIDQETDLVSWSDAMFSPAEREETLDGSTSVFLRGRSPSRFWTNNYAVTSQGLRRCPANRRAPSLNAHATTLQTFRTRVSHMRHLCLPDVLSMTLKSPASFTRLKFSTSPEELVRDIMKLHRREASIPEACSWAEPLVRQVEDLNDRLVKSVKCFPVSRTVVPQQPVTAEEKTSWLTRPFTRTHVINAIAQRLGSRSYLEIGCDNDRNFRQVAISKKVGVDPNRGGTHRMTSDQFFQSNSDRFDLIFIDGLHHEEQVLRDIDHSLAVLNDNGCILIHDCLPIEWQQQHRSPQTRAWTGDVWKAIVKTRLRPDVDIAVLDRCWGLGVLLKRPNTALLRDAPETTWNNYVAQRTHLLRILDPAAIERFFSTGASSNSVNGETPGAFAMEFPYGVIASRRRSECPTDRRTP